MIYATHIILSFYGHWLPNDPRGSGSRYVGSDTLYHLGGKATKTESRKSVAHVPHDICQRFKAKEGLKFPPLELTPEQIEVVGQAFAQTNVPIYACAIVPDHVHLLLGRSTVKIDNLIRDLKEAAVKELARRGLSPVSRIEGTLAPHAAATIWSVGAWKVFIDDLNHVESTIRYIQRHRPVRSWDFVKPFCPEIY